MNADIGYAIVRTQPSKESSPGLVHFDIKRVVWSEELAQAEVDRLNALHPDDDVFFFWHETSVDPRP